MKGPEYNIEVTRGPYTNRSEVSRHRTGSKMRTSWHRWIHQADNITSSPEQFQTANLSTRHQLHHWIKFTNIRLITPNCPGKVHLPGSPMTDRIHQITKLASRLIKERFYRTHLMTENKHITSSNHIDQARRWESEAMSIKDVIEIWKQKMLPLKIKLEIEMKKYV